jgi:hypothetical protein
MALSRTLAAAGISLSAIAGAAACDDFDDEMALQAAMNAYKVAQSQPADSRPAEAASASAPSEPTEAKVAVVEPQAPSTPEPSAQ